MLASPGRAIYWPQMAPPQHADSTPIFDELAEFLRRGAQDGRSRSDARLHLERLVLAADAQGVLAPVFAGLIAAGLYEPLRELLCADSIIDSLALRALARARPTYGVRELNAATNSLVLDQPPAHLAQSRYDILIVPGFTPLDADRPIHLRELEPAMQRVGLAAQDFLDGKAPYVLVTGGSVHPPGTPFNEALLMREHLMDKGVSPNRILVDPFARHTPTNLRNAGRLMLDLGLSRGLIVTGFERAIFSQAFYLSDGDLSTFNLRCQRTLGYQVGDLEPVDDNHILFQPSGACRTPSYSDPLDC